MEENSTYTVPALPYLKDIWKRLKSNAFINQETFNHREKNWYAKIEEHFEAYHAYFAQLGYSLEAGDGYYFLSEPRLGAQIESILRNNYGDYIKMLRVLNKFRPTLEPGSQFKFHDFLSFCDENDDIKMLLWPSQDDSLSSRVQFFIRKVQTEGFICANDDMSTVIVTSSFRYLKEYVLRAQLYGEYAKYNLSNETAPVDEGEPTLEEEKPAEDMELTYYDEPPYYFDPDISPDLPENDINKEYND